MQPHDGMSIKDPVCGYAYFTKLRFSSSAYHQDAIREHLLFI